MDDYADGMTLKNTLSHEVHVTQTSRGVTKLRALSASSQVVQLARVSVRELVVDVVCVILVLIARVVVHAVSTKFSYPIFWSWRYTLYTSPSLTVNCVSCYRIDHCNFSPNNCETHSTNRRFTDFRRFLRSISVKSIGVVMPQMRDATKNLAIATKTMKSFAPILVVSFILHFLEAMQG